MRTTRLAPLAVVTSCALLSAADVGQAQSPAVPSFTLKQVGSNVWAAIDNPAAKGVAAANGGSVMGDDGVAVIDSFASANAAKELLTEIRQRTKLPIKFVINTQDVIAFRDYLGTLRTLVGDVQRQEAELNGKKRVPRP